MTTTEPRTARDLALTQIDVAIQAADKAVGALYDDEPDLPLLADLLDQLRTRRQNLAAVEATVESLVARAMPKGKVDLPGMQLERHGGSAWKDWDHDRVAGRIIDQLDFVDPATGEMLEGVQIAYLVRDVLMQCGRPDWRLTPLRALNVKFDDLARREPSRRTVKVTRTDLKAAS